jgi:phosphocarrier protein HPr
METKRDARPEIIGIQSVVSRAQADRAAMSHDPPVVRRQIEITNSLGLHMRPADKFVKLALLFQSEIRVYHNGAEFNGKSILDLTSLAAECGTRLDLEARGPDAAQAVEALTALVLAQFYEDENGAPLEKEPAP